MESSVKNPLPRAWPVIFAQASVAFLIVGMVFVEYFIRRHVAAQVDQLVGDTQQSIVLLDDIRSKAQNLSEPGVTAHDLAGLTAALAVDARAYDPIATTAGEPEEWRHLQALLARLGAASPADQPARDRLANEIDASVDRLVSINATEGRARRETIRSAHRGLLRSDLGVAVVTLLIVIAISVVLARILARQRQMVAERLTLMSERTRDLEAFAGRAAHDLRSPMNPIRGYADLLLESTDSPEDVAMMARRIRTAVDRMARVVDDMLALSTAGRPLAGTSRTDEVVPIVLEEMGAELHGAEVTTKLAPGKVACATGVLHEILRNLLGNALKFRARTRTLEITLASVVVGAMVELSVTDNGLGMDEETLAHALEPMFRGRTDREVPGHGLGLAIVDRMARSLGGSCELRSELDRGTTVTVRLPRA